VSEYESTGATGYEFRVFLLLLLLLLRLLLLRRLCLLFILFIFPLLDTFSQYVGAQT
jgi:hypothetical protein